MSAAYDNFALAARERERRLAMEGDDPHNPIAQAQLAQLNYFRTPAWDAFFGSLREKRDDAEAHGKNFRVDLSGIGSLANPGGGMSSWDKDTARSNATNAYLGELTDQNRLKEERYKQTQAQTALAEAAARDAASQQQDRESVERAFQAGGRPARDIAGGRSMYATVAPDPNAAPLSMEARRENILKMMPGPLADIQRQQWAKQDALEANTGLVKAKTEAEQAKADAADNPDDNVTQAVSAMKEGTVPPQLPGRASKDYTKILAEAKRQGYDLATAATDWTATQKHIQTMNGAQQLRLNQAVNALPEMLDSVDDLASKWKGGKFPILNKANLALAKNGAFGKDAATIANQLDAQIADVTADLGNVYMGGNSPTDHALELAGKSLKADWDETVLRDMVKLAKKNVQIRQNSIRNTGVQGASAGNPYGSQRPAVAAPAPASAPGPKGADPLGIR
jgi:hypothetical protein